MQKCPVCAGEGIIEHAIGGFAICNNCEGKGTSSVTKLPCSFANEQLTSGKVEIALFERANGIKPMSARRTSTL